MAYEKRVAVLKQVNKGFTVDGGALSGAVYAERLGSELQLKVQAVGLAALKGGRYVLVFSAQKQTYCLDLGGGESIKIQNAPSIQKGFAILIAYMRECVQPVAFGKFGSEAADLATLLNAITAGDKKGIPVNPLPPFEIPPVGPNVPRAPTPPVPEPLPKKEAPDDRAPFFQRAVEYNDEAIAESDYFYDCVQEGDGNEDTASQVQGKKRKKQSGKNPSKDDGAFNPFLVTEGKLTYYKKVRDSIERAFEKFEKDTRLLSVFPRSEWVKTDGALLGVVYEDGLPRYLCVAVEKAGEPPEDMKEHCTFVPASPFTEEEGFYIVFQDADTGAYVNISES